MAIQQVSGVVDSKRLGLYFKKAHKTEDMYVEKSDELYISDRRILVRTFPVADMRDFTPSTLDQACYRANIPVAEQSFVSMKKGWNDFETYPVLAELKATRYLYECPQSKRVSDYYRKLVTKDTTEREIFINRAMLDIFSTDPDGLDDFLLELLENGNHGMIRISARYGHVAFAMPMFKK